jgi:hypothetical protein
MPEKTSKVGPDQEITIFLVRGVVRFYGPSGWEEQYPMRDQVIQHTISAVNKEGIWIACTLEAKFEEGKILLTIATNQAIPIVYEFSPENSKCVRISFKKNILKSITIKDH